jgi:hypothetical protein
VVIENGDRSLAVGFRPELRLCATSHTRLADGFQITCLYDHHSTFLDLPPLMLAIATFSIASRCLLKRARYPLSGTSSISSRAALVTKISTGAGPYCMAKRTPRIVSHAGFPIGERLMLTISQFSTSPVLPKSAWASSSRRFSSGRRPMTTPCRSEAAWLRTTGS